MDIAFADLVTPAGVVVAAGLIVGLIQLIKASFAGIDARISGASLAFFLSAVLYVLVALALRSEGAITTADGYLGVFAAWLTAATSAVGIKASFSHATSAPAKGQPLTDAIDESDPPA